ncbi:MAG: coenzyme F420-0:L-glutamate ligase [Caldilineaceae bacterium]
MTSMTLFAVEGIPLVKPGDDLAALICAGFTEMGETLQPGDILVVAQKIVSKAEGRLVRLRDVTPDRRAQGVAQAVRKDPRTVHVVLSDSREIVRMRPGLLVVEQRSAGSAPTPASIAAMWMKMRSWRCCLGTDAGAAALRAQLEAHRRRSGRHHQRQPRATLAWARWARASVARACRPSGTSAASTISTATNWGQRRVHCRRTGSAAASLLMGQSNEGRPVIVIRGYRLPDKPHRPATAIQRPAAMDVFR